MAPIESLTDDLLLDIISRLALKYVCRFKCASKHCLAFVNHPDHRMNLHRSLAGFFYNNESNEPFPISAPHFVNASGSGHPFINPSFTFLPDRRRLHLLNCCNGLILCRLYGDDDFRFRYVVCNPATEKWVALPDRSQAGSKVGMERLGFDPATSLHFHVFVLLLGARRFIGGLDVYSSESDRWIHKEKRWRLNVRLAHPRSATVFLNGYLHMHTVCAQRCSSISAVDTKGETWSNFHTPCDHLYGGDLFLAFMQKSRGHLLYACFNNGDDDDDNEAELQVYALEDYANKEWILKHRVVLSHTGIFGGIFEGEFDWFAIHPETNLIYFDEGSDRTLKCYSMDREKVTAVCTLGEGQPPYLPYVPLYSKVESLSM